MERPRIDAPLGTTALGLLAGVWAAGAGAASGAAAIGVAGVGIAWAGSRPLALAVLAGALLAGASPPVRTPGVYEIHGRVEHVSDALRGQVIVRMRADRIGTVARRARLRLRAPLHAVRGWRRHTTVHAIVRLTGEDDRGGFAGALPDARAIRSVRSPPRNPMRVVRARAARVYTRSLPEEHAAVARAMLLGDRGGLSSAQRRRFRDTGQAHLLAVSGLHVGLWLGALLVLLRLCGLGPRIQAVTALGAVGVYVPLTGWPPSAVRAGCAVTAYVVARLLGRTPTPLVVVSVVAVTLIVAQPATAHDVAFQLSFGAVLGILWLTPPITGVLLGPQVVLPGLLRPRRAPARRALAVSTAAWLGTLPVVASAIGHAAPTGPFVAVLAVPLTGLLLLCNMALLFLGWLPGLGAPCAWCARASIDALLGTLDAARWTGPGLLPIRAPGPPALLLYGAALALLVRARSRHAATAWLLAALALVAIWWSTASPSSAVRGYHPRSVDVLLALSNAPLREPGAVAALAGSLVLAAWVAIRMRWLQPAGAGAAWGLGMLAGWTFGAPGLGALFAPFLVATLLGKLPGSERSGARSARQVLSNGVPAALGCVLALLGQDVTGTAFFLGGLACLGSDSCATEIGVRYGGRPWSLTGVKVQPGESGGMTAAGTLAGLAGALLAPLGWMVFSGLPVAALLSLGAAGFGGSLIDSFLGATVQYRGRVQGSATVVESPTVDGIATERVRGIRMVDNDAVNLLSGVAAAAVAVALWNLGFGGALAG